jgi:hypothetical protein
LACILDRLISQYLKNQLFSSSFSVIDLQEERSSSLIGK